LTQPVYSASHNTCAYRCTSPTTATRSGSAASVCVQSAATIGRSRGPHRSAAWWTSVRRQVSTGRKRHVRRSLHWSTDRSASFDLWCVFTYFFFFFFHTRLRPIVGQPRQQQSEAETVQLGKTTGFDDVGHRLGLTTGSQISVCKMPCLSIGPTMPLTGIETVLTTFYQFINKFRYNKEDV